MRDGFFDESRAESVPNQAKKAGAVNGPPFFIAVGACAAGAGVV
jgi:hypothetical protein